MITSTPKQEPADTVTDAAPAMPERLHPRGASDDSGRQQVAYGAIGHNVLSRQEMDRLALWESLAEIDIDDETAKRALLVTRDRTHESSTAFDMLRTNIAQEMKKNGFVSLGITSPTSGCGSSVVALNLAFSLAQQKECRTLLIDLDLKAAGIAGMIGMENAPSIGDFLADQGCIEDNFRRVGSNLALALNTSVVSNSAELLQSSETARMLAAVRQRMEPDIVIYRLPPTLPSDDVLAFLPNLDCVAVVARADYSKVDEIDACERILAERTHVLGVVLNRCQYPASQYGYAFVAEE